VELNAALESSTIRKVRGLVCRKDARDRCPHDGLPIVRAVQHGQAVCECPREHVSRVLRDLTPSSHTVPTTAPMENPNSPSTAVTLASNVTWNFVHCGVSVTCCTDVVVPVGHLLLQTDGNRLAGRPLGPKHYVVALPLNDRDVAVLDRDVPVHALACVADIGAQGLLSLGHVAGFQLEGGGSAHAV